jgi:signal transduction histidine kinase
MVDEMLDVAHLRAGTPLKLRLATVDLVTLAENCIVEAQRDSPRHVVRVDAEIPTLMAEWNESSPEASAWEPARCRAGH